MKKLEEYVVSIPDYPEKGIIFRDVTSILEDPEGLQLSIRELQDRLEGMDFNIVIGPESRGFIFGMPIAYNLQKAFVPIRKKGKLPCETASIGSTPLKPAQVSVSSPCWTRCSTLFWKNISIKR